jgi:GrpB-like predicted nucleotidyltransferase (UPF0157 family)
MGRREPDAGAPIRRGEEQLAARGTPRRRTQGVVIVPYDPAWAKRFEVERERLRLLLGAAVRIEHVGSTAVPGLGAKPIIDTLVGARSLAEIEARIPDLEAAGYAYVSEHESVLPDRRFFAWPTLPPREVHVHAVELGTPFWREHLCFRDRLRADPELAADYDALKRRLAARHGNDREAYTEAKGPFIRSVIAGSV